MPPAPGIVVGMVVNNTHSAYYMLCNVLHTSYVHAFSKQSPGPIFTDKDTKTVRVQVTTIINKQGVKAWQSISEDLIVKKLLSY